MTFSEATRVEKKIGFVTSTTKSGRVSKDEVKEKFGKLFSNGEPTKRSKFTIVDGVPCKKVNGKLVPLTPLK